MEGPVEFVRDNFDRLEAAMDFKEWQKAQAKVDEARDKELDDLRRMINSQEKTIKKLEERHTRAFGFVTNLLERRPAGKLLLIA